MSVLLETSLGDIVIDLFVKEAPEHCYNFIKLAEVKYYNNCIFFEVQKNHSVMCGDPRVGGRKKQAPTTIEGFVNQKQTYLKDEINERKVAKMGMVGSANTAANMNTSKFFITLTDEWLENFQDKHTIFG